MKTTSQDLMYMDIAKRVAKESYCTRAKVGAVIVTKHGGIFIGFNGTIAGKSFPNVCECNGKTNTAIVIHAESNCLYKMLKEGVSAEGATLYTTLTPCEECTKMIISAGVDRVVYDEEYRDKSPLDTLIKAEVCVEKLLDKGETLQYL